MLIIGARGMAKEVFEVLQQNSYAGEILFFDDVTPDAPKEIYGSRVLRSLEEVKEQFRKNNNYALGLGNPALRKKIVDKFNAMGGLLNSIISPLATIGKFGNNIGQGCNILPGVVITNDVSIGKGALININVSISHDSVIGAFAEISPGAVITGRCSIGDHAFIGANASILPDVKIGINAIVGAGAVVTKDVADNTTVKGVPAK